MKHERQNIIQERAEIGMKMLAKQKPVTLEEAREQNGLAK